LTILSFLEFDRVSGSKYIRENFDSERFEILVLIFHKTNNSRNVKRWIRYFSNLNSEPKLARAFTTSASFMLLFCVFRSVTSGLRRLRRWATRLLLQCIVHWY